MYVQLLMPNSDRLPDHHRDTRTGNVSSPSSGAAQAPPTPQLGPVHKHVHGSVGLPQGSTLELEVFIDGSAVEVFVTNVGVAMSTRIYRSGGRKGGARAAEAKQQVGVHWSEAHLYVMPVKPALSSPLHVVPCATESMRYASTS